MLGLFKMFVAFLIVDIFYFILYILFSMRFQEYYLLYIFIRFCLKNTIFSLH